MKFRRKWVRRTPAGRMRVTGSQPIPVSLLPPFLTLSPFLLSLPLVGPIHLLSLLLILQLLLPKLSRSCLLFPSGWAVLPNPLFFLFSFHQSHTHKKITSQTYFLSIHVPFISSFIKYGPFHFHKRNSRFYLNNKFLKCPTTNINNFFVITPKSRTVCAHASVETSTTRSCQENKS